ncbi:uncharacterized protein LOC106994590 isoform X1 [Macaca mulatta]
MQRGPLSPSPTDSPGALGTWYPGVHRGQGMAGLRVPAFNASLRPITPSHAETQPPETTSSGMHREPLSSTSVAHCESQCRETTGPGMPCAPRAERPEAAGVRGAPPRVPLRVQSGPHAAGAAVVFSSSDLPFDAEAQGQVLEPTKDPHRELPATHRSWAPASQPSPLHRTPEEAVLTGSWSLPATREANVESVEQSPHRVLLGHTRNVQCQVPVAHAAPSWLVGEANVESMERSLHRVLLGHTWNVQCQVLTAHTAPSRLVGGAAPTPRVPVLQAAALALGSSGLWADSVCVWHEALAGVVNPARLWPVG